MGRRQWARAAVVIATVSLIVKLTACGGSEGGIPERGISTQGTGGSGGSTSFDGYTLSEISPIPFENSEATLNLSGESDGSEFLVVVTPTDTDRDTFTLRLGDASLSAPALMARSPEAQEEETPEGQFHQFLREMEPVLAQSEEPAGGDSKLMALAQAPEVGSSSVFRVLSSMSSITQFQEVNATLKAVTDRLLVYVDPSAEADIRDSDIEILIDRFERIAMPRVEELFGASLDINTDGRLTILMSCIPNRMATGGGIVTGFFSPTDRYARSSSNPVSNEQEILYTMVPDPDGSCGGIPISTSFTMGILPGVLAHEYQHLINFDHHIFVYRGATEEPWLNECLSHITEDLTGFGNENPSRVRLFLSQPSTTPLVPPTSPTLAERGACYAFLRYLYEQSGDPEGFLWNLTNSSRTGIENLEGSFAGTDPSFDDFSELANRWSVTLALSETGLTDDPRYNYRPRTRNTDTGNYEGLCIRCAAEDGRGTVLGGPVVASVTRLPVTLNGVASATQFLRISGDGLTDSLSVGGNDDFVGTTVEIQGP